MIKKRIKICVSSYDLKDWEKYTRGLVKKLLKSKEYDFIDYCVRIGPHIDKNRNNSIDNSPGIRAKLDPKITHYLHLDVDNEPTEEQIYKLLQHEEAIVGGVYPMNGDPDLLSVVNFRGENISVKGSLKKGTRPVKCMGIGTFLVDAKVYYTVPKPWYQAYYIIDKAINLKFLTEDFFFCIKAQEYGFNVYADFGLRIKHRIRDLEKFIKSFQL